MARTATITDDQILDAAREVFMQEGFRARTSKVAKLAGVSEGTIFKRFETKEHLFLAALSIPYPPAWHREVEGLVGVGDVKENLVKIGVMLLTYFQQTLPRLLTASGINVMPSPPPGPALMSDPKSPPMQDMRVIGNYLEREMDLGRLRRGDVSVLRMLVFSAFSSPIFPTVISKQSSSSVDVENFAENTVEVIWNGIAPQGA